MDTSTAAITEVAGKLAEATQAMADALHNINAQFDSLHAKIDRIVAAVDDTDATATSGEDAWLRAKLANTEKANHDSEGAGGADAPQDACRRWLTTLLAKVGSGKGRDDRGPGGGESVEWAEH